MSVSCLPALHLKETCGEECLHGYGEHLIFPDASQQESKGVEVFHTFSALLPKAPKRP